MARDVYARWQAEENEEMDEWLIRQRKAELEALVRRVIKNEFSNEDKLIIFLKFYKCLSVEKISEKTGLSRAGVYRRLDKINDVLYEKLKYALEYRFGINEKIPMSTVLDNVKNVGKKESTSVAQRLRTLRMSQHIKLKDVCLHTGIDEKRMLSLESFAQNLTANEVIKLSQFFKVSTDYILFGKNRVLKDPLTGLPFDYRC